MLQWLQFDCLRSLLGGSHGDLVAPRRRKARLKVALLSHSYPGKLDQRAGSPCFEAAMSQIVLVAALASDSEHWSPPGQKSCLTAAAPALHKFQI